MLHVKKFLLSYHVVGIIGFKQDSITVSESEGVANLTVAVMGAQLATNAEVVVSLSTSTGTADG